MMSNVLLHDSDYVAIAHPHKWNHFTIINYLLMKKNHTYYFITPFILVSYKLIKVGAWCVALIKEQLMPRHHYLWIMITETDDIALIEKERVLVIVVLSKHNFYPHVGWQFFLRGVQLCILRFLNQYLQVSLFLHLISYLKIANQIKLFDIKS